MFQKYFEELQGYTSAASSWYRIDPKDPDLTTNVLQDAKSIEAPTSTEFAGSTIEDAYDYFKAHLRPADDAITGMPFSSFCFLVVDEACLASQPWECIICCDAPDFGEAADEITLKQIRLDMEDTMTYLPVLEELAITPDEVEDVEMDLTFESMKQEYKAVTPSEARKNKKRSLLLTEQALSKQAEHTRQAEVQWGMSKGELREEMGDSKVLERQNVLDHKANPNELAVSMNGTGPENDNNNEGEAKPEERDENSVINSETDNDIAITTRSKLDMVYKAPILRQMRQLARRGGEEPYLFSFQDNYEERFESQMNAFQARYAAGPSRPVFSSERPVYGPVIEGQEKPIIDSGARTQKLPVPNREILTTMGR
ncbi:MAG: hypothetical protein Q9222_005947 [Ikaeria aurantiellina]